MVKEKPIEEVLSERTILLEKYYLFHRKPLKYQHYDPNPVKWQLHHALKEQLENNLRENDYWLYWYREYKDETPDEELPAGFLKWALELGLLIIED